MTLDLSVAMLVRDPPMDRLATLVQYMGRWASEFVIVDTGSSDRDVATMRAWNRAPFALPKLLLLVRPWRDDFAWARNEALPGITRQWVLHLDPDELPRIEMMEHVERVVTGKSGAPRTNGWLYLAENYIDGIRIPAQESDWHCRLFRKGSGEWYRALDELVKIDGAPEHETRGTPALLKAPQGATFLHSRMESKALKSAELYHRMEKEGAYRRSL